LVIATASTVPATACGSVNAGPPTITKLPYATPRAVVVGSAALPPTG
jgi:hypothetical protein